jgi:uncharacterized repeat protein (TIGR03803 family)
LCTAIFLALQLFPAALLAQTLIPLYQFGNGIGPNGGLISDAAGNLYGTTSGGGTDYGYVFELTNSAGVWSQNVLYNFQGTTQGDGRYPRAGLIFNPEGDLFGTTSSGGHGGYCDFRGCGTVFAMAPQPGGTWKERVLHRFQSAGTPMNSLIMDAAGNLYGTGLAWNGVPGIVFELSPGAKGIWKLTTLYTFEETKGNQGTDPVAPLIFDGAGNLYGTAENGGQYKAGTAYRLTPGSGGWTFTALYAFGNSAIHDGAQPTAGFVMDASGNLYGTTTQGGTNGYGTVFELSPTPKGRWKETILHEFAAEDGEQPATGLIFDSAGNLYGVAPQGGQFNCGTIFELSPSAGSWNFNTIYSFANNGDGCHPSGPLLDFQGNLYGVSNAVAFELTP